MKINIIKKGGKITTNVVVVERWCLSFPVLPQSDIFTYPVFTSAEDETDPMVIVKLDISNVLGSLCARLVFDVLFDKVSRDYAGIKVDEEFETTVHELRTYFGFFKMTHTRETTLTTLMMGLPTT